MIINATCSVAHCLSTHSSCCRVDGCNITAHLVRSLISICSEIIHAGTKVPGINVVYLGATVRENADLTVKINRCVLLANLRFRRCGLPLYDQSTAMLRLKVRMLKAEAMKPSVRVCFVEPHRGSSRHTAHGSPPIAPPLHRMEEKTSRRLSHAMLRRPACQDWL